MSRFAAKRPDARADAPRTVLYVPVSVLFTGLIVLVAVAGRHGHVPAQRAPARGRRQRPRGARAARNPRRTTGCWRPAAWRACSRSRRTPPAPTARCSAHMRPRCAPIQHRGVLHRHGHRRLLPRAPARGRIRQVRRAARDGVRRPGSDARQRRSRATFRFRCAAAPARQRGARRLRGVRSARARLVPARARRSELVRTEPYAFFCAVSPA